MKEETISEAEEMVVMLRDPEQELWGWPLSGEERRWVDSLEAVFAGGWQ